jgi:hypothetical protein
MDALVLLVYGTHECCCGRQYLVNKYEDGLLRRELDALADYVDELPNGQILLAMIPQFNVHQLSQSNAEFVTHRWNEVLLLVDRRDICSVCFLADNLATQSASI